jgi:predicted regulator of Ras-like GTPase activity (Roadblock/LC7/MglB family)
LVDQLEEMNRDFRAEVILLTAGSELIAKAGTMQEARAQKLTILAAKAAAVAAQAASFLGERSKQFEQSMHEGDQYRLYSYSLGEGVVLSIALSASVPLGIVRHQTRRTCQELIKEYIG